MSNIRKVIIGTIYGLTAILIVLFIPKIFEFSFSKQNFINSNFIFLFQRIVQVVVFIFFLIIPFIFIKGGGFKGSSLTENDENLGSSKKGTLSELKGITVPINHPNGGFVLSKNVRMSMEKSFEHLGVIGPTGSGKSSTFFIPTILDSNGKNSIVVSDPKKEMYDKCGPYLRSIGYEVVYLDPINFYGGGDYLYNPLILADDFSSIRELAQLILVNGSKSIELQMGGGGGGGDQATWINMSVPLLAAALSFSKNKGSRKSINEAIDICLTIGDTKEDLEKAESIFKADEIAFKNFQLFKSAGGSEKTLSSIKTVLTSNIQLFLDKKIEDFTRTPIKIDPSSGKKVIDTDRMFNPKTLREKPVALFICLPENKSTHASPLMAVIYNQILNATMDYFGEGHDMPIFYLLDEFANIGVIPTIGTVATTGRSRKIGLAIGIQGIDQLEANYGKNLKDTLLNNLKTNIVYSGLKGVNAEYVSELTGTTTIKSTSTSTSSGGNGGDLIGGMMGGNVQTTTSKQSRALYDKGEIRRLNEDNVLIISQNRNPVEDKKNVYYTQKKYLDKVNIDSKNKNKK